ncbi:hypothetical protein ANCCAN_05340 [Ancylostoma caninum]|uniref:Uncharacterized protein n=1 Tax=Ancylostoma caninum TaxID=29170 RepID=A0A368GZR3_ANCCA|nr:hypothetical protein ANCCAN_05340 [Ancylostoma caninum]
MRDARNLPLKQDVLYFFLLNVSSAFMLSAAHNVLYFVLDIKTPVIHFLHHFFTFWFMMLLYALGCIPKGSLPLEMKSRDERLVTEIRRKFQEFKIPVIAKFSETMLSSVVHSQHRQGELYLARIFDFVFTFTLLYVGKKLVPSRAGGKPQPNLMVALALSASLSWLEFGQLEFSTMSFLCAPLLAIARAISLLTMQRAFIRCSESTSAAHVEQFCLYYTGFTTLALFLPALISYSMSHVEVDASWESIDYTLMGLSFLFMSCNLYSDLWLGLQLNSRVYATLDHTKYLGASIGQWIIQNMAHPNVLALGGKVLTIACLFRIWSRS